MKRLYCFLCLFLSLCLLLPVSLVSASALVEVDGIYGYLAWWYDDPQDYVSFTNQVVSTSDFNHITVQVDIDLINPIEAKTVFDIDLGFNFSNVGSITVTKFQPLNTSNVAIDNLSVSVVNNKISVTDLQYKEDVKYIRVQFLIERPTWVIENAEGNITIAGKTYKYQRSTTWSEWCNSDYDTLGLYVENGKVYGADVQLMYNGASVNSSDWIVEDGVYTLEPLGTVGTLINFSIYYNGNVATYQGESNMDWSAWCDSDYNTKGYKITNGKVYSSGGLQLYSGTNLNGNIPVKSDDILVEGNQYILLNTALTYGIVNYKFNFSLTSVSVEAHDEKGLLGGIIEWLKQLVQDVKQIPSKVADLVGTKLMELGSWLVDQIKGLFIPSEQSIVELKDKFEQLLRDRFGAVYDASDIIDDFADSFVFTDTDHSVTFPEINVNLAGADFSFGGWEVDVIPEGFEGMVTVLKTIVSMVCTILFVMAMRRRLEEVLNG